MDFFCVDNDSFCIFANFSLSLFNDFTSSDVSSAASPININAPTAVATTPAINPNGLDFIVMFNNFIARVNPATPPVVAMVAILNATLPAAINFWEICVAITTDL